MHGDVRITISAIEKSFILQPSVYPQTMAVDGDKDDLIWQWFTVEIQQSFTVLDSYVYAFVSRSISYIKHPSTRFKPILELKW